jgi:hypothetical protein
MYSRNENRTQSNISSLKFCGASLNFLTTRGLVNRSEVSERRSVDQNTLRSLTKLNATVTSRLPAGTVVNTGKLILLFLWSDA